MQAERL